MSPARALETEDGFGTLGPLDMTTPSLVQRPETPEEPIQAVTIGFDDKPREARNRTRTARA
jgi:hypothetical protein